MPTYVYLGHGRDLTKKISGPGEPEKWNVSSIETVPEGCTYATISETGSNVTAFVYFYFLKVAGDPIKKQLLMKPKDNFYELKKLVTGHDKDFLDSYVISRNSGGYDKPTTETSKDIQKLLNNLQKHSLNHIYNSSYHFKLPGNRYINRHCNFLLYFKNHDDTDTIRIHRSGLYDIEKTIDPPLPSKTEDIIINTQPMIDKEGKVVILDNGNTIQILKIGDIKKIYKDSIFPTIDNILSVIKGISSTVDINNDNMPVPYIYLMIAVQKIVDEINQKEIFERFPGNHFNFSCRGYEGDDGDDAKLTPARIRELRQESKRQIYKGTFMNRLKQFNPFRRKTQVAPVARKGRKNRTRKL